MVVCSRIIGSYFGDVDIRSFNYQQRESPKRIIVLYIFG